MIKPPDYFAKIQQRTLARWKQLEGDSELAGPWHQLFAQVQSPRHVFSELLQNADDANAKTVRAYINQGEFIFEHDGDDFTEEHFSSLCRFGYSNKRNLHTIGFRGIGFKSTFSLGDDVKLFTPTLSVKFNRSRFTKPVWEGTEEVVENTQVRVKIKDSKREQELEINLSEWASSPISLLFFRSIQHIVIQDKAIHRKSLGEGPIGDSEWIRLSDEQKTPYLLIRSDEGSFPEDSVEEIRQERMVSESLELPPCSIDIVLAHDKTSELYVVLPTGLKTKLQFICNGPFIQDPARVKIKDPEISPTNRWLLERTGQVAAKSMLSWLNSKKLGVEERGKAYELFPDVDRDDNSVEGVCGTICEEAFEKEIEDQKFLLAENGQMLPSQKAISMPLRLYDIWQPEQLSKLFDSKQRSMISKNISSANLKKLKNWNLIEEIDDTQILDTLNKCHCPKPETWRQLLLLWDYVFRKTDSYYERRSRSEYRIVPVQSKEILFSSTEVVRLGEKKLLQRKEDWEFLSEYLVVLKHGWTRFLAKKLLKAKTEQNNILLEQVENANELLKSCHLDETSDISRIINSVASKFYEQDECSLESCICLAHISAALSATVGDDFQYVICDGYRKASDQSIVADKENNLDLFVNERWYQEHILHENYFKEYLSCTESQWLQWVESERSKVLSFVPIQAKRYNCWSRSKLKKICAERGIENYSFPYVTDKFLINDWDFAKEHWEYWKEQAKEDDEYWGRLFKKILNSHRKAWASTLSIKVSQVATTGNTRAITNDEATPEWILKFCELPCLQDTHGWYRKPTELFRRTPQTEALLNVESFVRAEYDTEQNRSLLIKLGLQDKPTGPEILLERLKALAKADNPQIYEIQKWYNRLDQLYDVCSTDNQQLIKNTFANEPIILTADENWTRSTEVFLQGDAEEVPDAPLVHPALSHLSLWGKIGVPLRPTAELALGWLGNIEIGTKLSPDEIRRVRSLLARYAVHVWTDCQCWLNLDGQWVGVDQLTYKLAMQSLVSYGNLFPATKQKTADCTRLSFELYNSAPFSELSNLADHIKERIQEGLSQLSEASEKAWIRTLGSCISRIVIDDEIEAARIQQRAQRLASTKWQPVSGLEVVPFIDGTPSGTARTTDVAWKDTVLFVEDRRLARLYKAIAQELARPFDRADIAEAIKACVDRSPEFIIEYFEENFKLAPPVPIKAKTTDTFEMDSTTGSSEEDGVEPTPQPPTLESEDQKSDTDVEDVEDEILDGELPDDELLESEGEETQEHPGATTPTTRPRPPRPRLIELYAKSLGYCKDGQTGRFYHNDGSWIQKAASNSAFPWERYSTEGELLKCYWLKEHCIHRQPLQLSAELWNLCCKYPDKYSLIIIDLEDKPLELTGCKLQELINDESLTLHPATYRLVLDTEKTDGTGI